MGNDMTNQKTWVQLGLLIAVVGFTAVITWHVAREDLSRCEVDDTLRPLAGLLEENQKIIGSLQHDGYAESEAALLTTYLALIRKDGVPKNSAMKQRIDQIGNNNTAVLTLLSKLSARAHTPAFRVAADHYRDYAISFRDRWQSLFEVFMAGGNLPANGPTMPSDLLTATGQEIHQRD